MKTSLHRPPPSREAGAAQPRASRSAWLSGATVVLVAASFLVGRFTAPVPAAPTCPEPPPAVDLARALRGVRSDQPQPKMPVRDIITPPVHLTQAADEQAAEELRSYESRQGHDLVALLRARVRRASLMAADPNNFELIVGQLNEYISGWADALVRTSPTLNDDLAHEIEKALCDPKTPQVEAMLYARVGRLMPELTSTAGFDCVLKAKLNEGPVLWEVLGSLQTSGLPAPGSLAQVEASAKDERTLRILHPPAPEPEPVEPESDEEPVDLEAQRAVFDEMLAGRSQGLRPLGTP